MRTYLVAGLAAVGGSACGSPDPGIPPAEIVIPAGATWQQAMDSLTEHDVVRTAWWFNVVARLRGVPSQLKRGTYRFRPNEHFSVIFGEITVGRSAETRVIVREGLMLDEIADVLASALGVRSEDVLAAARDPGLIAEFGLSVPSLEGYLYPETYILPVNMTARDAIRHMGREFFRRWNPGWDARLDTIGFTQHELVTLASVIEGETQDATERLFVAGVYHNRLRRGMPLQADPTVIYALGERRRLFERDYRVQHPYNTYRIRGLPPGPIGSPSEGSLHAALYPTNVPYLFFVAGPDGRHIFSRTNAEHERARALVRTLREERR